MKVYLNKFLFFIFSVSMVFSVSEAGAVWLLINPGAVAQGTGEAQVAKADDAYASYYNPAGLGFISKKQYGLQHVNWLPNLADDLYFDYIGVNIPLGTPVADEIKDNSIYNHYGTVGVNLRYLNLGEQMCMNSVGDECGLFKSYMFAAQASYGTTISKHSAVGFSFKVFHQRLAEIGVEGEGQGGGQEEGSSTDIGFDLGYLLHFGKLKQHSFGLAVHNIGPPIDFVDSEQADPAPTNMKLGFKVQLQKTEDNELNFLFDMNKLLVASYPAMDWNGDGMISGSDELEHSDEWYKGIITAWLDDWYYGGDYDETIPSSFDNDVLTDFWFIQVDQSNYGYADGIIGGFEERSWNHVMHDLDGNDIIGDDLTGWSTTASGISESNSLVYVPNYSGFCEETYRAFKGNTSSGSDYYQNPATDEFEVYSMCYDQNGQNYNPSLSYFDNQQNGYVEHAWIDMPHDGFGAMDVYHVSCNPAENYDCTVDDAGNDNINNNVAFDYDGDGVNEIIGSSHIVGEDEQTYTRLDVAYDGNTDDGRGEYSFNESEYGYYNPYGFTEKGSGDDRSFQKELEEIIYNFGLEYKYTENFTLRAGFIYDLEGAIKSPTVGAGIKFANYGFDFGYTSGDTGHPRANTMFFSLSIDV